MSVKYTLLKIISTYQLRQMPFSAFENSLKTECPELVEICGWQEVNKIIKEAEWDGLVDIEYGRAVIKGFTMTPTGLGWVKLEGMVNGNQA